MDEDLFIYATYFLNGPLISVLFVSGTLLNFLVLFILHFRMYRRKSVYGNIIQASGQLALYFTVKKRPHEPPQCNTECYEKNESLEILIYLPSKPQICIYLLWTTSCDITLLTSAFFTYSIPTLLDCYTGVYVYWLPLLYTLCNATLTISVWHTFALMIDRWRALSSSFTDALTALLATNTRVHRVLFMVTITAIAFSIPRYFEFEIVVDEKYDGIYLQQSKLTKNIFYMIGYRIICGLFFYSALPYLLLLSLSLKIYYSNREAHKIRQKLSSVYIKHRVSDSEKLFIAIIVKFLISRLLTTALDITEHLIGAETFFRSNEILFVAQLSNLIVIMSSGANFFIFYYFSTSFRSGVHFIIG